ncbi:hypothetical protein [Peribacillus simplex]|uniref:hypothetical protein n=1 Tax=Peribacillus simplex TaxID=1478 RepID=UPI0024C1C187|nr:hypothetical protein [Peribacillus simplex]WHY54321.1 hypothetical protein QNH43_14060 [Peribacillus simplex]
MNTLKNSITKKGLNHTLFLGCGRVMGKSISESSDDNQVYLVGSLVNLVCFNKKEYDIYLQTINAKTKEEWVNNCVKNRLVTNAKELEAYEESFKKEHILIHQNISEIDDPIFFKFTIAKRGISFGYSKKEKKWIISSVNPKGNNLRLSHEEYDMWRSSSGICTIWDTMHHFMKIRGCTATEALSIFIKNMNRFCKIGLWNIEYCGDNKDIYATEHEQERTFKGKWFDVHNLKTDSIIVAAGEEFGGSGDQIEIIIGNQNVFVEKAEFLIWLLCKKNQNTILKMKEQLDMDESQIRDIVKRLIGKKLLMIWPDAWVFDESYSVSAVPLGTSIGMINNENYEAKDLPIGKGQLLPVSMYFVWIFSHGFASLGVTVQALKESLNIRQKEAELLVAQSIPVLIEKGLMDIQIIPKRKMNP